MTKQEAIDLLTPSVEWSDAFYNYEKNKQSLIDRGHGWVVDTLEASAERGAILLVASVAVGTDEQLNELKRLMRATEYAFLVGRGNGDPIGMRGALKRGDDQ